MRNKLIEIIRSVQYNDNGSTIGKNFQSRFVERIADHLIENGVTVGKDNNVPSKWISVKDRLPEKGEIVLACGKRHATSGMFQGASPKNPKVWHWKGNTLKEVTHWMPLPEPPGEIDDA